LLTVLYLVPNAADAAVARRVSMLRQGGARVVLAGFRRAGTERPKLDVIDYIELGETFDANFKQRIGAVLSASVGLRTRFAAVAEPDLILARNLEMLALADRLVGAWADRPAIGYECLDIHRLMLRGDAVGRAMRTAERYFARKDKGHWELYTNVHYDNGGFRGGRVRDVADHGETADLGGDGFGEFCVEVADGDQFKICQRRLRQAGDPAQVPTAHAAAPDQCELDALRHVLSQRPSVGRARWYSNGSAILIAEQVRELPGRVQDHTGQAL